MAAIIIRSEGQRKSLHAATEFNASELKSRTHITRNDIRSRYKNVPNRPDRTGSVENDFARAGCERG